MFGFGFADWSGVSVLWVRYKGNIVGVDLFGVGLQVFVGLLLLWWFCMPLNLSALEG